MKYAIIVLLLVVTHSVCGQQIQYVTADNGLIVREQPDKNAIRTGKLVYGARVKVLQVTDIELKIKDGQEDIIGNWVEVQEMDGNQKGYVFNGYLTSNHVSKKIEISFHDFSLQMGLAVWDDEGTLKGVQNDSIKVQIELGDTPEGKKVKYKPSNYKNIEVYQRYETSITIMNEGPHCDLTDWKHYYSAWEKLKVNTKENTFISNTYEREDWEKFISVDLNELKEEVKNQCGEQWSDLITNIKTVNEYPSGVSMSRIFFKIILTDENDSVTEKTISFEIPMGC